MAAQGGKDPARNQAGDDESEKQSVFSKVKDKLNFTKHLGFVSDLDSPANQAYLAAARERGELDGDPDDVPEVPVSEKVKQGVNSVTEAAMGASAVAAGGMTPQTDSPTERAEKHVEQAPLSGGTLDRPNADLSGAAKGKREGADALGSKDSEQSKGSEQHKSWGLWSGHKEKHPQEEKDSGSFAHWAGHTAKKLGKMVASKDLSDDLLKKDAKK